MKHKVKSTIGELAVFLLAAAASSGVNAGSVLNTADTQNGIYKIYSFTFDGSGTACPGTTYCDFFGFDPPAASTLFIVPNPSGVIHAVPGGIGPNGIPNTTPAPGAGSWLDLTLGAGNTTATLNRGFVTVPDIEIKQPGDGSGFDVIAHRGGFVIVDPGAAIAGALTPAGGGSTGKTVGIVANKAVFEIQQGGAIQADFSRFSQVVTSCTGTFCALITGDVLNLDMVRYVLEITFDPTFTSFTAKFMGQTGNTSIVFANLNSIDVVATNSDPDAWPDVVDNCTLVSNDNQRDTNADGYGNICDPDFNGDGTVNVNDFNRLKARLNITPVVDVDTDMDGNNAVNINDLNRLKTFLTKPPGPSGLHPNCPPTCP